MSNKNLNAAMISFNFSVKISVIPMTHRYYCHHHCCCCLTIELMMVTARIYIFSDISLMISSSHTQELTETRSLTVTKQKKHNRRFVEEDEEVKKKIKSSVCPLLRKSRLFLQKPVSYFSILFYFF